jgi:hypothetical protein
MIYRQELVTGAPTNPQRGTDAVQAGTRNDDTGNKGPRERWWNVSMFKKKLWLTQRTQADSA